MWYDDVREFPDSKKIGAFLGKAIILGTRPKFWEAVYCDKISISQNIICIAPLGGSRLDRYVRVVVSIDRSGSCC